MNGKRAKALKRKARAVTAGRPEVVTKALYRMLKRAYKLGKVDGEGEPK